MKKGFYLRLAWTAILKNKRLYTPYILTCIGMVMMYYIVLFLRTSTILENIPGQEMMRSMLDLGSWVIAVFSAIFLFYTNSFLIRRRMKEFGLYNILGMGKWHIGMIVVWETIIVAVLALTIGLMAGAALSKFAELLMSMLLHGEITYTLSVSAKGMLSTAGMFSVVFLLMMIHSLRRIHSATAISLLRSENAGEKPPKANWLLGLSGIVLLVMAYDIAVSIQDPMSALVWFFVAVLMVIAGTYLTFVSGSVLLCRILQKNKWYYYKPNHFVSVSSMAYRMKRNGAGLASICILATMVLVMLASTTCLYFGSEDAIETRYPRDISLVVETRQADGLSGDLLTAYRQAAQAQAAEQGVSLENVQDYHRAAIAGMVKDGVLTVDAGSMDLNSLDVYNDLRQVYFVPLEDYNRAMNTEETLTDGEVLLYVSRGTYDADRLNIEGGRNYRVKKQLPECFFSGEAAMSMVTALVVIVPDYEQTLASMAQWTDSRGQTMLEMCWEYSFDLPLSASEEIAYYEQLRNTLRTSGLTTSVTGMSFESRAANREDFYGTFGSLFFLGVMLSIVFLFAAVLIIYYKQISEGYEDQARFAIMRKVGMTVREIRRSINAQLLLVFFLPLITAGLHLCFAFPMLQKLLMLFNLVNVRLLVMTTLVSALMFAALYLLVYRITANGYFQIVSGEREA